MTERRPTRNCAVRHFISCIDSTKLDVSFLSEREDPSINILYEDLADSLISEKTFEIMIENVSCCVWCTVPASGLSQH